MLPLPSSTPPGLFFPFPLTHFWQWHHHERSERSRHALCCSSSILPCSAPAALPQNQPQTSARGIPQPGDGTLHPLLEDEAMCWLHTAGPRFLLAPAAVWLPSASGMQQMHGVGCFHGWHAGMVLCLLPAVPWDAGMHAIDCVTMVCSCCVQLCKQGMQLSLVVGLWLGVQHSPCFSRTALRKL